MRKLIKIIVMIAVLWGAWWWVATTGMQRGAQSWLEGRRTVGWQAEAAVISSSGFPMRLHLTLKDTRLADPATAVALTLPQLDIETPVYWPGYVTISVPSEPITLASPDGQVTLALGDAAARLRLHPGTALELETLGLTAGQWALLSQYNDPLISAQSLTLKAVQTQDQPEAYQFDVRADDLVPGLMLSHILKVPPHWPRKLDSFLAEMTVTFDRPWDRTALEDRRPQPRHIALRVADVKWADLHLRLVADVTVDARGRGTGKVSIKAENWPTMLEMVQAAGMLPGSLRAQIEGSMRNFAELSGDPNTLDVTLTLKEGQMSLGFIPLGPAPLFVLR